MSWDVLVWSVPSDIVTLDELTQRIDKLGQDSVFGRLGSLHEIVETIQAALPDADFSDRSWGRLRGDGFSIEFNVGDDDPVVSIMLHIRGGGELLPVLRTLCEQTGWRLFDISESRFMDFGRDAVRGWQRWQAYRDQVVGRPARRSVVSDE